MKIIKQIEPELKIDKQSSLLLNMLYSKHQKEKGSTIGLASSTLLTYSNDETLFRLFCRKIFKDQ